MTLCRCPSRTRPLALPTRGRAARLVLLLAGWWLAVHVACAAEVAPQIVDIQLGFASKFRVGRWTPATVTLRGGATDVRGRLEITALDGEGVPARIVWQQRSPITVPAGKTTIVQTTVRQGRLRGPLTVDFVREDGQVASRRFAAGEIPAAAPASQSLVVTVGDDLGLGDVLRHRQRDPDEAALVAHVAEPRDLPDVWWGYAGVDTVTLTTAESDACDQMSDRQIDALDRWVLLGGRLILSVGSRGPHLLDGDGRWARFLPGRFERETTLRETTGLETITKAGRVEQAPGGERPEVAASIVQDIAGRVDVFEGTLRSGRPLVIRGAHGLGQVVFVAVDLDTPPLKQWEGRPRLVELLLSRATANPDVDPDETGSGQAAHVGYKDLSGQLRAALDQFPGVRVIPFSIVAGMIVLYVALIGPADYFFLRRFTRRMEWTWLTFSTIALLFCGSAWWLVRLSKGNDLRVNQVALIDIDAESAMVRGTVWANVYTPRADAFDLRLRVESGLDLRAGPSPPPGQGRGGRGELLTWLGLPGSALGGMSTSAPTDLLAGGYTIADETPANTGPDLKIFQMPLNAASSRSLIGQWWGRAVAGKRGTLQRDDVGLLAGRITNPLNVDLTDCIVLYDHWAYSLGRVDAGQQVALDESLAPRNLDTLLRQRRIEDMKDVTTPWDQSGSHVPRIMQMIMFHEAAGGRAYTGLLHRHRGEFDLSDHLQTGRAVLVGRATSPAAQLTVNGQAPAGKQEGQSGTYFRMIFPVKQNGDRGGD